MRSIGVMAALMPVALVVLFGLLGFGARTITTIGGLSQLGGVGLVAYTLSEAHGRFGELRFPARIWKWITAMVRRMMFWRRPRPVSSSVSIAVDQVKGGTSVGTVEFGTSDPDATLDDRVAALEEAIKSIKVLIGEIDTKCANARSAILRHVKDEVRMRESAIAHVQGQIKTMALGDTGPNLLGVAWFLQGIVFATWPNLVSSLVR